MARAASPGAGGKAVSASKRKAKRARAGDAESEGDPSAKPKSSSKTKGASARKAPAKSKAPAKGKASAKKKPGGAKGGARAGAGKSKSASKTKTSVGRKAKAAAKLKPRAQYAALPFRLTGTMEILLVTSRDTARWVIPKGWPIRGKSRRATAAAEARQEAGLLGEIGKTPLGQYDYVKVLKTGLGLPCRVTVFPLLVTGRKLRWREQTQRSAQWFDPETAAQSVQEPQLSEIIQRFADDYLALARGLAGRTES